MALPTEEELEAKYPLPHRHRWSYNSKIPGNRRYGLFYLRVQRKTHFLGLIHWKKIGGNILVSNSYDMDMIEWLLERSPIHKGLS